MEQYRQQQKIKDNQKFLLKLLNLHIGNYYPLRKWLGISYSGKIDEITNLSIAYNTKYFKKGKKWFKQVTRTYQSPDLGYKLCQVLDKIPQLVFIPALLQPAYGLGALAFFFLTQTTYQPSSKDTYLYQGYPTTNYGDATLFMIHDEKDYSMRSILEFDISDIPSNAIFTQGDMLLYYYTYNVSNPSGKTTWAYKLTRTDWVEAQATWNIYKTGSNWTSAGGDYVTSNPSGGSVNMPASYGWVTWDIKDIVADACSNSNNVEVLVKFANEAIVGSSRSMPNFYSKEYTDNTSLRPKLTVTYTTPTAFTATLTETLTPTDALSKSQGSSQSLSETLTLSDTLTKEDAYDFITTCNWTQTGTYTLSAYRGSFTNIAGSVSLFYRKKGAETWIETTNGQINIDSTGEWEVANNWNKSGNDVLTHSYYGITAINSCTEVYFNETTLGSSVGDYFLGFCWYSCSSLTSMPSGFNLPSGITSVGNHFLYNCWYGCSSLTSMPSGFNLPSGITSVGDYFLNGCWDGCSSLTSMPSGFNLPSGITSAGICFLYNCWYRCSFLTSMPSGFNLPSGITSVGDYFLYYCWRNCSSLTSMPSGFNLPSGITSVGNHFLYNCWYSCSSLTSMPSGFNLPSGITSVGSSFLSFCWDGCSSLTSMPSGFNLPSGITTVGDCFLYYCWYNCTSLTQTGYTEDLVFEFDSTNTFAGTCPITPDSITGASKENPVSVAVHRPSATFEVFLSEVLTSLDTLTKQSFFSKALSESLTLSEVLSKTTNFIKSFSESIGLTDAIDNVYGKLLSLIETINLADTTISKTWNATITFLETTTLSDIVDKLSTWAKSLAETLSLSDTITKGINTVITITETLSLSDILTKTASWVKSLTETTIMSDIIKFGGNWWNRLTKHTSIWTEGTKHSSSIWTHKNKSN